ncbi:MAG TPA: helix-hairpin-helix domain-containing protein [Acidobacteriaceae bacterium]|nr:helix-hairpin-helix domain-containing protein [Acidobacteriaceae bacterium]
MRILATAVVVSMLALAGCTTESRSPDAIREQTANATAAAKRDAKAVAQGVFEGLSRKGPVNINKATKEELLTLPGVSETTADAIIAGRPYSRSSELVRKHIVSKAEYDSIADRVVSTR